jgi:hypothetical protein
MVNSLADSGPGTLRAAITSVNSDTTADEIDFSVAGVIKLTSGALPPITNTVKIDGKTAPGFASAPVVEIDNNGSAGLAFKNTVQNNIQTGSPVDSRLASLSIVNANGPGVTIEGNNTTVVGNWIGLALGGTVAANTGVGLLVNSAGDFIGGTTVTDRNVISGNGAGGITLNAGIGGGGNVNILGNFIGIDSTGQIARPNQGNGITLNSTGNMVGTGNVIAFNTQYGVAMSGSASNGVVGNSIYNNGQGGINLPQGSYPYSAAPQISYVKVSPGPVPGTSTVQVGGGLGSYANTTYKIQLFATLASTPSGQGQILLGTVTVKTDSSGLAGFTLLNASMPSGSGATFTATATSQYNSTSTFSAVVSATATPNQIYVANVYILLLNRAPDPSASGWVDSLNNGASPASVVLGVEGSTEYLNDQVNQIYLRYLKRQAYYFDQQGWTKFIQGGGTFEQVSAAVTGSDEYFRLQGSTNQGFVTGLYRDVLNRTATDADIAAWVAILDGGASRDSVSTAFLTSHEYRTELVQADYLTYLLRPADSAGLTAFVNALNAGATDQQVLAEIFGSLEGYQIWS